ncbi:unnamed protein product [Trichogramma brassicae]|uniref:Uncharacterized protein n=1 Tax=Trichogramma brassicae TaxID=86971 RepID=A0A6H5IS10_9HYME|nr:unnamed protein product [Trichogramma brassicae]
MATIVDIPVRYRIFSSGQTLFARPRAPRRRLTRIARMSRVQQKLLDRCIIRPSSEPVGTTATATSCRSSKPTEDSTGDSPLAQRKRTSTGSTYLCTIIEGPASREHRQGIFSRRSVQGVFTRSRSKKKTYKRRAVTTPSSLPNF